MLDINSYTFTASNLDQYGHVCGNFLFCKSYFRYIKELKSHKFGVTNIIDVCTYQDYLDVLKELILVKKAVIVCAYPIISILKLRPNGVSLLVLYHQILGHAVILPQNPGLLLYLLFFNGLLLNKIIKMIWVSKQPYIAANILLYRHVKKEQVLNALLWLKEKNSFYENLTINY